MALKYNIVKNAPIKLTHDKDNIEVYTLVYRPNPWAAGLEVIDGVTCIIPTTSNGCMYVASQGGRTGGSEPTWLTGTGSTTASGTAKFTAVPYSLLLNEGDTLNSFSIIKPDSISLDNSAITGNSIRFRVTGATVLGEHELIIRSNITLSTGLTVSHDTSLFLTIT